AVAIHPLAVIVAIAAGIVLAGIVGALIAVPIVAMLNTAIGHLGKRRPPPPDSVIISANPNLWWSSPSIRRELGQHGWFVGCDAGEESVEIVFRVLPVEGSGGEVVEILEGDQSVLDVGEVVEVVGCHDFALYHEK
ncbi:AI-2E family transporter, partial [Allorhizocola rhizosphaerae]|uniref:AI-2E family transporter n=1 Tax=Allorhizocola rhizosphaerae TaxID=1872709 RepID=UPI001FE8E4A6